MRGPVLFPTQLRTPKLNLKKLNGVVQRAMTDIVTIIKRSRTRNRLVWSSTFGDDDPMTLSWLTELLLRPPAGVAADIRLRQVVREVAKDVCRSRTRDHILSFRSRAEPGVRKRTEQPHCFLWLRLLHLAKAAAHLSTARRPGWRFAQGARHRLEEIRGRVVSTVGLFHRDRFPVRSGIHWFSHWRASSNWTRRRSATTPSHPGFARLAESQARNPYWRPVMPFLGDSQGMVLFPVSVEISNSLLRSYEILERARSVRPHRATLEALLRRYAQWLEARIERRLYGAREDRYAIGWHSEHVNPAWVDSPLGNQARCCSFSSITGSLLQRKIAAEGLSHAGLRLRELEKSDRINDYWEDGTFL